MGLRNKVCIGVLWEPLDEVPPFILQGYIIVTGDRFVLGEEWNPPELRCACVRADWWSGVLESYQVCLKCKVEKRFVLKK